MIDLDALEALEKRTREFPFAITVYAEICNALPELIRLARIGQRVERDHGVRKEPDFLSQALNEGNGVYRP